MSRQSEIRAHLGLLGELSSIVGAMKNMAQVEVHRTERIEQIQGEALATVTGSMALFHQFYPEMIADRLPGPSVMVLIGSERGFCGGFNDQVVRAFTSQTEGHDTILVVGDRLAGKMNIDDRTTCIPGPATIDEVPIRGQELTDHLLRLTPPISRLTLIHHGAHGVAPAVVFPWPEVAGIDTAPSLCFNLPPPLLLRELQWHCLQQGLLHALLLSLAVENRMRMQQMERAMDHLDELTRTLRLRQNTLRQQEIIEEIEMMLTERSD